jgi:hypothetical protein
MLYLKNDPGSLSSVSILLILFHALTHTKTYNKICVDKNTTSTTLFPFYQPFCEKPEFTWIHEQKNV